KGQIMSILKDRMRAAAKLLLVACFSNETGMIQWNVIKFQVEEINREIDKAEGAREALAAASAMHRQVGSDATTGE
ncbi:MAG: hypothetical protein ACKPKO_50275, partial [Candidatus Fonsibacter sp.]